MSSQRILFSIITAAAIAAPLTGQAVTAADAFVKAPHSVLPLREESTRLDMIDYFNAGSERASRNTLYGNSRITSLTPEHIVLEVTAASTMEMVTLPLTSSSADSVIVVIHTVATPVPDSKVTLYNKSWEPISGGVFTAPGIDQWLKPDSGRSGRDEVEALLPFMLTSCSYDAATKSFVFTNRSAEFLSEEVYEPIKMYLQNKLVYTWDGKRLALRK